MNEIFAHPGWANPVPSFFEKKKITSTEKLIAHIMFS